MSDEEKEALRNFKSEYETCDHYSSDLIIELDDAEILLNLIEKQSKEIEELKEKYRIQKGLYETYGISKDKIKAKIEEYENKIKKIRSKKLINEPEDTIVITRYAHYISVLQSLLEKE